MKRAAFSLIEMMIAVMLLSVAMVGLVGAITWSAVNVSLQDEKSKAVSIATIVLEEMEDLQLEEIVDRDWDKWVKDNGYDFGLSDLKIQIDFPLVYDEEENGMAYPWGYTYRWGVIWAGHYKPSQIRPLIRVDLTVQWLHKGQEVSYKVSTLFSSISRGIG